MPSHGVDIIDGMPVFLKGSNMFAFRPEQAAGQPDLKLGTYDSATKKAAWSQEPGVMDSWLTSFRENLAPRSRK